MRRWRAAPFGEDGVGRVEHLLPLLVPGDRVGRLAPEVLRVLERLRERLLVRAARPVRVDHERLRARELPRPERGRRRTRSSECETRDLGHGMLP